MSSEQPTPVSGFLGAERSQVAESRRLRGLEVSGTDDSAGLALSAGGPRSIAFTLGVLQGLARGGLLRKVDYLSSTGTGSHLAGWLASWILRDGFEEVEKQLAVARSGAGEAAAIHGLGPSTIYLARSLFGNSRALLTWLRNVVLNFVPLVAALGAWLILEPLAASQAVLSTVGLFAAVLAAMAAILILSYALAPEKASRSGNWHIWFGAIVTTFIVAAVILYADVSRAYPGDPFAGEWLWRGSVIGVFCVFLWPFARSASSKSGPVSLLLVLGRHLFSAAAVTFFEGFILFLVALGWTRHTWYDLNGWYREFAENRAFGLVLLGMALAVALYKVLMGKRMPQPLKDFCRPFIQIISGMAVLSVVFAATSVNSAWTGIFDLLAAILVLVGLLGPSMLTKTGWFQDLLGWTERVAPLILIAALAASVADIVISRFRFLNWQEASALGVGLLTIGSVAIWRIYASDLTMQGFDRARVARAYLAADQRVALTDFAANRKYSGPYPLFNTSVSLTRSTGSETSPIRTAPFVLAPLYSGFEPVLKAPVGESALPSWQPTERIARKLSAAAAMAISGTLRAGPGPATSHPVAFFRSVFDVWDGLWVGNPMRGGTGGRTRPLFAPLYALMEGLRCEGAEPAFLRLSSGVETDSLAVFELVRRRCRFVVACDANEDPIWGFEQLGATIRRCRTELNVEIEIDLAPLGRNSSTSKAHSQMAVIRYPEGEAGLLLYVKPSLTGDESTDLSQYASTHPEFPSSGAGPNFDEAAFESYRRLGEHIADSLFPETDEAKKPARSAGHAFRILRRRLQPDYKVPESDETSSAPVTTDAPPEGLVDAIASGECVLCTFQGLGAQAGLPTWDQFLEGVLGAAPQLIDAPTVSALKAALSAGEQEAAADELIHLLPRDIAADYARSCMSGRSPAEAHRLLGRMDFLGVLNTGFDELLQEAFALHNRGDDKASRVLVPANTEEIVAALQAKSFFNVNVFGTAALSSSLIFTAKEFRALLAANVSFRQFLSTLFLRYTVLFVGGGIDGIRSFLDTLELPQRPERRHYALVAASDKPDPVRLRYLDRSWNLQVVGYQPGFKYAGFVAALDGLSSAVEAKGRHSLSKSLKLQNVTLENIGPFESLNLDLAPSWNVVLGDNGVGKTVVLKAIAAALCGEKADPSAVTRLLRSGAASGSIRLKVEGREYAVDLRRDKEGEVKIVSASLSPLIYDKWLVLGFPALRSVPWGTPKGPEKAHPGAPTADDLLPILRSQPDDRISNLKQWLVNLDYANTDQSRKLLNTFFETLQKLTPDLQVRLHGIDKTTFEITIETDGGLVPLESISQGTGSVMCWIGTLIERLAEATDTGEPKDGAALVLIDEIDAHMHPKWQQMFVEMFREQFKNVQVIASTHSPLLVGSLKSEEIWLVHRIPLKSDIYGRVKFETMSTGETEITVTGPEPDVDEGEIPPKREERRYRAPAGVEMRVKNNDPVEAGEVLTNGAVRVAAERIEIGQQGWRADQILTGPLFELETTRDPKTRALLREYNELTALENHNDEQELRLVEVARKLQVRLPSQHEKEAGRKAYDLISSFAGEALKKLEPGDRRKVLDEVKIQLTESITGSRRPE